MVHTSISDLLVAPKSIFITGASSGLGRALALSYAAEGVTLFLCGRNTERLENTAQLSREKGAQVHTYIFDVNDAQETEAALKTANALCPLELVIANAGVSGGILGTKESALSTRTILETNIFGVVNTVQPAIELFKKNGRGQLALVSSTAGYRGLASCPAYSASKVCVKAWGEALRVFLRPHQIAVSVICPGFIATPLTDANTFRMPLIMSADKAAEIIKKRLRKNAAIIAFPWPMAFAAWFGSILPSSLFSLFSGWLPKKER